MTGAISLMDFAAQTQDDMRGGLIQKVTNESVFMRILRFVTVDGFKYLYGEQATLGGVSFRQLNGSYTADTGVVNPKEETLAILGGLVKTDVQLAQVRGGVARTNQIMAKMRKAGLFFDKYCIDGDPAVTPSSFYGLKTRLIGNQLIYPAADANNGGALALGDVDKLLDAVAGPNETKTLIMRKAERTKIKQLVVAAAGGASVADVGKTMSSYDGAAIEVLDEDGDEAPILPKTETRGSSNVTSSMYCIRPGGSDEGEWVQGLLSDKIVQHMPQGAQGTSYYDLIEMLGGLAVFHGRAAARLAGIL